MPNTAALEVKNLTVKFGDFIAVNNISFSVKTGEIFGFLGANGAGKTTTIRVLCGLLPPTSGEIKVAGRSHALDGIELKKRVGYMSQKFTLWEDMTVEENLLFTSQLRKMSTEDLEKRKNFLFKLINYDRSPKTFVRDLPGGLKQQVSLAAALIHNPDIVFLDEPTAGVTPIARTRFWSLIRRVAREGKTVFVTTHYMDEAEQCDRIALMRAGEIVAFDTPAALKKNSFPKGLLELEAKNKEGASLPLDVVNALKKNSAFSLFEPHGMRFHIEIADMKKWEALRAEVEKNFDIRPIQASLEDVFIRLVEDQSP